jgi:hypothetical protein
MPTLPTPIATIAPQKILPKKSCVDLTSTDSALNGKLNWLKVSPLVSEMPVVGPLPAPVVAPPVNWADMVHKMKSEGISIVKKETGGDWITPKTKSQKREERAVPVVTRAPAPRAVYMHQHTSLCRSVIQGVQCTHAVCRYAHDVEKITLRNCGFETCRNVTCVGDGVYRNTGRNVCNYLHQGETRDSYYKRLDIYKYKK